MSSDTMYFNSSRLLPTNSRNRTPPVKQSQNFPLSPHHSQKANLNVNVNVDVSKKSSSSKNNSDYIGDFNDNDTISNKNKNKSNHKNDNKTKKHEQQSNSTKNSQKSNKSKQQQLVNGQKSNVGNSASNNSNNNNKNNNSNNNIKKKNHQKEGKTNNLSHRTTNKNHEGDHNNRKSDHKHKKSDDLSEVIQNAMNMAIGDKPEDSYSTVQDHDNHQFSSRNSFPEQRKTSNTLPQTQTNGFSNTNQETSTSPKSPIQTPIMAPPVFVAPPHTAGSPLVQPINHMVNLHPHHPSMQQNLPKQQMMMQPQMFPHQPLQQQHQQQHQPLPPHPHYGYNVNHNNNQFHQHHNLPAPMVPQLPMQMHLSVPMQPNSSSNGGFGIPGNSIMLHPAPPQSPQPHFMNMANPHHQQSMQMLPNSNMQQHHGGLPAPVQQDLSSNNINNSNSKERKSSLSESSSSSVSGSQYAGASFTINAPTIKKLPKPSFI